MTLTARPRFLSWDHDILDGAERVARLDVAWIRERGRIEIRGMTYEIGRRGVVNPVFYLLEEGRTLVEARKPRWYRRRFEIEVGSRHYELAARSVFRRSFDLRFEGDVVGTIAPRGIFTRKIRIDLPDELPIELQVFMTWLVVILWRRARSSGGGG